jgi:hypothetical protein
MQWLEFVKEFRKDNPHITYSEALKRCSAPFKKHKKKLKYTEPKLKRKKKPTNDEEDCGCYKVKNITLKKSMKERVKKECGICDRKKGSPKKPIRIKIGSGSSKRRKVKPAKPNTKQENQ